MTTIVTLTLSPALDASTSTPRIYPEGKLRCVHPTFEPGGGGINVARAVVRLGGEATAIFPAGGATGERLVELLQAEGVKVSVEPIVDWTRESLHVLEESSREQYRFVMPGAVLTEEELARLMARVDELTANALLVISGSLPPGTGPEVVADLIRRAKARGALCVVDSSGPAMAAAVKEGGLALIKPNQSELAELSGKPLGDPHDVMLAASALVRQGAAAMVVVSLGPQGALAVGDGEHVQVVPPPVRKLTTVGAGDSMVGAMALKLAAGAPLLEILRYGVAAGTAATLNPGTRLCSPEDTQCLYDYLCRTTPLQVT